MYGEIETWLVELYDERVRFTATLDVCYLRHDGTQTHPLYRGFRWQRFKL
jgi:hypothetical protein